MSAEMQAGQCDRVDHGWKGCDVLYAGAGHTTQEQRTSLGDDDSMQTGHGDWIEGAILVFFWFECLRVCIRGIIPLSFSVS